jgi:hypothetical protein
MQKNSLKTFLFVLSVTLFLLAGCKKYEDGPYLSFKSKSKLLEGEWKLVKVNGE